MQDVSLDSLPVHLLARIFNVLETKERARVAVICKSWKTIADANWSALTLTFTSLRQLEVHRQWLDAVASKSAGTLRSCELHWRGRALLHPAAGSLHVEQFTHLERLHLKPPDSAYWAMNPKAIKSLAPLKCLRELVLAFNPGKKPASIDSISLDEFAGFSNLRKLQIVLTHVKGIGWNVKLSPSLQGLCFLEDLVLLGVNKLAACDTFRLLLRQLSSLDLTVREPISETLEAPRLRALKYHALGAEKLPFVGLVRLLELDSNAPPDMEVADNSLLQKLHLGYSTLITAASVSTLGQLKHLRVVDIDGYFAAATETLEAFGSLDRLEKLHVTLSSLENVILRPALSHLQHLREMKVSTCDCNSVTLGSGVGSFPALERLHVQVSEVLLPFSSDTLRVLSVESQHGDLVNEDAMLGDIRFGSLPRLHSLHLKFIYTLQGCSELAGQLCQLPNLRELYVAKWHGLWFPRFHNRVRPDPAGTYERMLHSFKQIKGLRVLQVAAVNDSVSLSGSILPQVQYLGLACKGLAICPSCLPWSTKSLNLVFRSTSKLSKELLNHSAEVVPYLTPDFEGWRARLPGQGPLTCDFDDYL